MKNEGNKNDKNPLKKNELNNLKHSYFFFNSTLHRDFCKLNKSHVYLLYQS